MAPVFISVKLSYDFAASTVKPPHRNIHSFGFFSPVSMQVKTSDLMWFLVWSHSS